MTYPKDDPPGTIRRPVRRHADLELTLGNFEPHPAHPDRKTPYVKMREDRPTPEGPKRKTYDNS